MAVNNQLHDRIKVVAEELRRELYGPSGAPRWGTRFTEVEDLGVEIGDLLAREVIGQSLGAQEIPAEVVPTVADQDGPVGEVEVRIVQTRRGEVQWKEPKGYNQSSRKAFFPSVAGPGDCAGRHGEPSGVGEDGVRGDAEP